MVLSKDEIQSRKDLILALTIEQYVNSVTPVGSTYIANKFPGGLSSATIRNIFAELEDEGLLTHPHTSAGRVPTQQGYRYYVDHLMKEIKLLEAEQARIKNEITSQSLELETLLEKTSELITDTTQYTSIISVDGWDGKLIYRGTDLVVNYPDQRDIEKIQHILMALERKEELLEVINRELDKKINIYIGHEIACRSIDSCSIVITKYQTRRGPSGRLAVLGPTRMKYERVVGALEYLTNLMEDFE